MSEKTGVIVISSSDILCGGLMTVLARTEFAVDECLPSVPANTDAGLILVDPTVAGYSERGERMRKCPWRMEMISGVFSFTR